MSTDTSHLPKLTVKQMGAVRHFILHGNKTEAYRKNYNCEKMKPESIQRKAVELFDNVKVAAWVEHYQKEEAKEFTFTVEEKKKLLVAGAKLGLKMKKDAQGNQIPINITGMKECIAELNRMDGDHAAVRFAHGGDPDAEPISVTHATSSILDGIDIEQLSEKELDSLIAAVDTINRLRPADGGEGETPST